MSTFTPNFNIELPEGTDTFNPLTFNNTAFTTCDTQMKANQNTGLQTATHSYQNHIHTIVRTVTTANEIVFIATGDWTSTDTISVDGTQVTFRMADGTTPGTGAFVINQAVVCYLNGTILTMVSASSHTTAFNEITDRLDDDEADIEALNSKIKNYVITSDANFPAATGTIAGGGSQVYTVTPPTISGYEAVGIIGYSMQSSYWNVYNTTMQSNGKFNFGIRNLLSTDATLPAGSCTAVILYRRTIS